MRVATVRNGDRVLTGTVIGDHLVDLGSAFADATAIVSEAADPEGRARIEALAETAPAVALGGCSFLPPIPEPHRILCVGTNYAAHVSESDRVSERPDHPMIFTRFPSSLVGHGQPLERPAESTAFDYEGELAVVIGRKARRVDSDDASTVIGGYSCFMDGTIRDWQRHTSQFTPGKNFERSGSWGPWIVTADEISDPYALQVTTKVDGTVVQDAPTHNLIFDIGDIVAYCSTFTTLEPGDVIATGTPGGVGYARDPQIWLGPGNEVRVEITGVGELVNPIIEEDS